MSFTESLEAVIARNGNGLLSTAPHWSRVRLGDVAQILNGFPFPSTRFSKEQGVPLLRIRDALRDRTEAFYDGDVDAAYLVEPGDLVVGMDGDFNAAIWRGPRAALNQRVCKISPNEELYDRRLLSYVLPGYLSAINAATSSITVKHLSSRTVADIPLPLPPRAEQRRIVAALEEHLSDLDAAVAALERVRAALPHYRAAVLKAACEGRLVETEAEVAVREGREYESAQALFTRIRNERNTRLRRGLGKDAAVPELPLSKLPEGWTWALWDEIGTSQNGRAFPSAEYGNSGVKLLRPGNLHASGQVRWTEENTRWLPEKWAQEYSRFIVRGGELVMNLTAQSLRDEFLGRVCVTGPGDLCLLNQRIARLTALVVNRRYLLAVFKSDLFRRFVKDLNTGSLIQHMFTSQLAHFWIPLPPLQEQDRIVAEVDRRHSLADAAERVVEAGLAKAKRLRQAILKRAFEGRLVPQDPNDEPASVLLERIRALKTEPDRLGESFNRRQHQNAK